MSTIVVPEGNFMHQKPQGKSEKTCYAYDEVMLKHCNIFDRDHPEKPDRLSVAYDRFKDLGYDLRCAKTKSRIVTDKELFLVHSPEYIEKIKELHLYQDHELESTAERYDSVYFSKFTEECARMAAGCTLAVVQDVLSGKCQNGVAIVRPPGHHAEHDFCMGYSYFNNVALAAKYAQTEWNVKRVLVVDWDIHHGNGIQHLFKSDPSVLYFSIHRYDNGNFWPEKEYSNFDFIGEGEGMGYNINVAWNKRHMTDADYIAAFHRILLPVAYEFSPDLVLVAAGFDSARGDPKGLCDVSPEGYAHLTRMLTSLAGGKVVLVLEGGYNLTSVAESLCSCVATLLGDPCPQLEPLIPSESALESINNTQEQHSKYWTCLRRYSPAKNDAS